MRLWTIVALERVAASRVGFGERSGRLRASPALASTRIQVRPGFTPLPHSCPRLESPAHLRPVTSPLGRSSSKRHGREARPLKVSAQRYCSANPAFVNVSPMTLTDSRVPDAQCAAGRQVVRDGLLTPARGNCVTGKPQPCERAPDRGCAFSFSQFAP